MSLGANCPVCGSETSADTLDGLCLKCLGRLAFLPEPDGPAANGRLRLGDYELIAEIARGGMGVVYRARQLSLNRLVALKVVLNGPFTSRDFVRRFRQEARAVAALRHPNIVAIHEVGEDHGRHFLSLELVDGRSFAELARERPLPARRAAAYLKTIAGAVEHAHQRGVLHRDLKPSNILLDVFDQPRITDFGLAKIATPDAELTATGEVLGSPNYMPPEQAAGKFADSTAASDVYSLGAILYELITGRPPFQGESVPAVLAQVQGTEPVPPRRLNPDIPVDLQTICLKCLQKEPGRRYDSAQALADDLGCFLERQPIRARPVPVWERAGLWCRRRPLQAALSVSLVAAVVLGLAGIVWQWQAAEFYARGEMKQRLIAEQDAAETRLNLYAANVAVAAQEIHDGLPSLARRTLQTLRPPPGDPDLRGFEWYYLWNLSRGDQLATLKGHQRIVTCAAFSPAGDRLASGGMDGTVRLWDMDKRALATTLNVTTSAVWSVAFTPDGRELMTGCNERVQLWDPASGRVTAQFPGQLAALAPAGNLLATAQSSPFFWDSAGTVSLWNWRTGALRGRLGQPGRNLALSADGRLLAVAGANTGFTVWATDPCRLVQAYATKNPVWSLNFSPDGRRLLTTDWSSDVAVWTLDHAAPPQVLAGHQLHVWSAVYSADGATIATTSSDQSARLWDAATLLPKLSLHGHTSEVWCAAFSPDGSLLATGGKDQNVLLWPVTAANQPGELPNDMTFRPLFSPDGTRLVTVSPNTGNSMLWNVGDHTVISSNLAKGGEVAGFSPDGKYVATFNSNTVSLDYWLPGGAAPEERTALRGLAGNPVPVAWWGMSPEQAYFFAIDDHGMIYVWNTATGELTRQMNGPAAPIRNAVLSTRGRRLAVSVESENLARLYDCATGVEFKLAGHRDFVSGLAFSPDGATLATGSMDGAIRLWRTADGTSLATLPGHLQETTDVAFSPDGRTLGSLARNESFKLWHLATLREVVSEKAPQAGMWLVFSPDGRQLAVETTADQVRLFAAPAD